MSDEDYKRLLEASIREVSSTVKRIEDKLDSKSTITDQRLDKVEKKLAWYAGALAVISAGLGFVGANAKTVWSTLTNI